MANVSASPDDILAFSQALTIIAHWAFPAGIGAAIVAYFGYRSRSRQELVEPKSPFAITAMYSEQAVIERMARALERVAEAQERLADCTEAQTKATRDQNEIMHERNVILRRRE